MRSTIYKNQQEYLLIAKKHSINTAATSYLPCIKSRICKNRIDFIFILNWEGKILIGRWDFFFFFFCPCAPTIFFLLFIQKECLLCLELLLNGLSLLVLLLVAHKPLCMMVIFKSLAILFEKEKTYNWSCI